MTPNPKQKPFWRTAPVLLALALVVVFFGLFLFAMVSYQAPQNTASDEEDYMERVNALLEDADPAHGEELTETYQCVNCHFSGEGNVIAPPFVGISERAAERKPPLSAPEYIYESITQPMAFVVPDYAPSMPQNFKERMTDEELGDVIAYLLTQ